MEILKKDKILLLLLIASTFITLISPAKAPIPKAQGDINFQPNIIPELNIHFIEEFFRFQWLNNRFDLKLLIAYNETNNMKFLSLKNFWEKSDRRVKWREMINNATNSMYEFGYLINDIPQEIAENVEYLVWKIEGANFDVDLIELEVIEHIPDINYNITRIHLPNNLVLSYEDLFLYNFTVSHINKLDTIVKGVKGKTELNLDPITFSSPIITISGFTEGTPCTFEDIYQADVGGGWGVVWKQGSSQYLFNCTLKFGADFANTWFADSNVEVEFMHGIVTAWQKIIDFYPAFMGSTHFRLGTLSDATNKITENPVELICWEYTNSYYIIYAASSVDIEVELYETILKANKTAYTMTYFQSPTVIYNCHFDTITLDFTGVYGTIDLYRTNIQKAFWGMLSYVSSPIYEDILLHSNDYALRLFGAFGGNIENSLFRNNTKMAFVAAITVNFNFINCISDNWEFTFSGDSTAEIYRQYTYDLTVTYPNGSAIENASVLILRSLDSPYLWTSPENHADPLNEWIDETEAYDNDLLTFTKTDLEAAYPSWSSFIYFNYSVPLLANGVRFDSTFNVATRPALMDVDVKLNGTWIDVYEGVIYSGWQPKTFPQGDVDTIRFRMRANAPLYLYPDFWGIINEVDLLGIPIYDFSGLTNSTGQIPTQTLTMGFYNQTGGDTIYSYNPYLLTITFDGYQTYMQTFNITQKEDLTLSLQVDETIADITFGIVAGAIIASIFVGIIAYAVADNRKR